MNDEGVIFSDESGHGSEHRYGAICTISGTRRDLLDLHGHLEPVIQNSGKSEIKFYKVSGAEYLNLAKRFIDIGLDFICLRKIRVHVLVWDKHDSRHSVQGRDDIKNLARMYYHILKQIHRDWKHINYWNFYPDEYSPIDWKNDIVQYSEKTGFPQEADLFREFSNLNIFPNYTKVEEKASETMFCIQLADLFTGIVRYSRKNSQAYQKYIKPKEQLTIFDSEPSIKISNNMKPKLSLMKYFHEESKSRALGINFSKNKYFSTFNKKTNIFIWHYEPQSELDKAPYN